MFNFIGGAVVYGLATFGLYKLLEDRLYKRCRQKAA